jgi:DNA-binding CsgD family transcriptional regulator
MLGDLIERLAGRANTREQAHRLLSSLTKREREILLFLTHGADNDAMAQELFISPQTARTHVQNVLAKLEVHSRLEAIAFVNRNALLADLELSGTRAHGRTPSPVDTAGTLAHRNRWVAAGRTNPRKSPAAPIPGGTPTSSSRAPDPGVAVQASK